MGLDLPPKILRQLVSEAHDAIAPPRAAAADAYDSFQVRQLAEIVEACRR
jgi:hypothetical protein